MRILDTTQQNNNVIPAKAGIQACFSESTGSCKSVEKLKTSLDSRLDSLRIAARGQQHTNNNMYNFKIGINS